jgi:hypothetical protein
MKVALVFAGKFSAMSAFLPYRSHGFVSALAAEGVEAVLVDIDIGRHPRFARAANDAPGVTYYRNEADRLPLIAAQERADLVQTFGATLDLASVWNEAAKGDAPIVHFVASEGAIEEPPAALGLGFVRGQTASRRLAEWRTRFASRQVAGLVGSNRADVGRHMRLGYFPRAHFSVVTPPPTIPSAIERSTPVAAAGGRPVFGFYDPEASEAALRFFFRTLDLAGPLDASQIRIAPARLKALAPDRTAPASFVDAADAAEFVRGVDVLVAPEAQDRALQTIVAALAARKAAIVPDAGAATELVEYGRHGVLYVPGSAYHLAMAINLMAQSWSNRPFSFEGVEAAIARTSVTAVAAAFAAAYRRLAR